MYLLASNLIVAAILVSWRFLFVWSQRDMTAS